MANATNHKGLCPAPFLDLSTFGSNGGNLDARMCAPLSSDLHCCLPCPATDWVYPPNFKHWYKAAESISAIGLACTTFLLASWMFLPPEKSHRHYFSICLSIGTVLICLAFVIPLTVRPNQCYDEITPNDMYSNLACAFSGASVVAGAVTTAVWIFVRALSMHLQVCWNIFPGKRFFYGTQILSWSAIVTFFTLNITVTGVSYRFGETCHINSHNATRNYWGPLFGIAGSAGLFQFLTLVYCINVYLKYRWQEQSDISIGSDNLPTSSLPGTDSARIIYRRVQRALLLHWRSVLLILFLLLDVIFYATVYVKLDKIITAAENGSPQGMARMLPFIICLIEHNGDRSKCFDAGGKALVSENTALAILVLLSIAGIQCFFLLARTSMFPAWYKLLTKPFMGKDELQSPDTPPPALPLHHRSDRAHIVELHAVYHKPKIYKFKDIIVEEDNLVSPSDAYSPTTPPRTAERVYRQPRMSFSGPTPPQQQASRRDWESQMIINTPSAVRVRTVAPRSREQKNASFPSPEALSSDEERDTYEQARAVTVERVLRTSVREH